jgi:hypothetical protein
MSATYCQKSIELAVLELRSFKDTAFNPVVFIAHTCRQHSTQFPGFIHWQAMMTAQTGCNRMPTVELKLISCTSGFLSGNTAQPCQHVLHLLAHSSVLLMNWVVPILICLPARHNHSLATEHVHAQRLSLQYMLASSLSTCS